MAFKGSAPGGAWINPSGITAWTKAAAQYAQMAGKVNDSASTATSKTVLQSVKDATKDDFPEVSAAFTVFYDGEEPYIGVQGDLADDARTMEFGTETQSPMPALRFAMADNKAQAVSTFEQGLL